MLLSADILKKGFYMRGKLAIVLRKQFNDQLKKEIPQFKNIEPDKIEFLGKMEDAIPKGNRLYLWDCRKDMYFYLLLTIATPTRGDAFTIEFAYSIKRKFPATLPLMHPFDIPESDICHDTPKDGEFRFRIGEFLQPGKDHWWWLAPNIYDVRFNEITFFKDFENDFNELCEVPIEQALKNVAPCVNEAIIIIKKYAIPYFEKIKTEYDNNPDFWMQFEENTNHSL